MNPRTYTGISGIHNLCQQLGFYEIFKVAARISCIIFTNSISKLEKEIRLHTIRFGIIDLWLEWKTDLIRAMTSIKAEIGNERI